jgi:hypothetical protein
VDAKWRVGKSWLNFPEEDSSSSESAANKEDANGKGERTL